MTSLTILYLDNNTFSGAIPNSLGNITGLQKLTLPFNRLSSSIPNGIWNLRGLLILDLSQNILEGSLAVEVGNLKAIDTMDLSMNRLSGDIPSAIGELQMLTYFDISNNSFYGQIPDSFGKLINAQYLKLSSNTLSGVIPKSLANLPYLIKLDLSFNKLEGEIPEGRVFSNFTIPYLKGNIALCGAPKLFFPPCHANNDITTSRKGSSLLKYLLPVIASIAVLFTCLCLIFSYCRGRKNKNSNQGTTNTSHLNDYRLISYHELVRASDNFSETNLLGRGHFGSVFKGCLDDGLVVAIKVLNLEIEGAWRSFEAECQTLSMVRHRNLIKIISTCSNLDLRAIIIQFMQNGSLEKKLYSDAQYLTLLQRINIMIDVSLALEHLHHHHSHVVLHCDLKPSNVLLDANMTAHVSDFGIAKLLHGDSRSLVSTNTPGTIGYVAPEYGLTGRVSRRGDVYSFGILMLEMITKKKPTDAMFHGESSMRQWVCKTYPSSVFEIVDKNLLQANYNNQDEVDAVHKCLSSIIELGLFCSKDSPKERIPMEDAVQKLLKIKVDYLSKMPSVLE